MTVSPEFIRFVYSWLTKAESYSTSGIEGCFDKFFRLFVAYNRLYAEATFSLARQGQIDLNNRNTFPDSKASKTYVLQYVGASELLTAFSDVETSRALETIMGHIKDGTFAIKLHLVTGEPQRDADLELLKKLQSLLGAGQWKNSDVCPVTTALQR